jgi:hypothetical protein
MLTCLQSYTTISYTAAILIPVHNSGFTVTTFGLTYTQRNSSHAC